jgi:steroid 5-alpha reductase family enzyme
MKTKKSEKVKGLAWILVAYLVALAAALLTGSLFPDLSPLWIVLIADTAGTVVIFIFSLIFKNASFYDAYWSVAPIVIVGYYLLIGPAEADFIRVVAVSSLVLIWGIRLTYNWARGWTGLDHEDWRYGNLRNQTGIFYPLVNFMGIHFFPTLMVYAGCLGLYNAMVIPENAFGFIDLLGIIIGLTGIYWEAKADLQLHHYKQSNPPKGSFLTTGLWAYCRHPNYFGEISFWIGICILGLAANSSFIWPVAGPVAMILMFVFISIPMIDKRMKKSRAGYQAHIQEVSAIIPIRKK